MDYKTAIAAFVPQNAQEENDKRVLLDFVGHIGDTCLCRESELAHITSSGFVMNPALDKVLLVHHNIRGVWAWMGGHADGDKDLLSVALREAQEETGATGFAPLFEDIASIDILPVWGHQKNGRYVSAHLHLSIAYLLVCDDSAPLRACPGENTAVAWFPTSWFTEENLAAPDVALYTKLIGRAQAFQKS